MVEEPSEKDTGAPRQEVFDELRRKISEHVEEEHHRSRLMERVEELEEAAETSHFAALFTKFVALEGDFVEILLPILPALARLGGG